MQRANHEFARWLRQLRWILDHVNETNESVDAPCCGLVPIPSTGIPNELGFERCTNIVSVPFWIFELKNLPKLPGRDLFTCHDCKNRNVKDQKKTAAPTR